MKNRELILDFVQRFPGRDDDEISAALKIRPRQTVNMECRQLAYLNQIERKVGQRGKICNYPKNDRRAVRDVGRRPAGPSMSASEETTVRVDQEWHWEGNVIDAIENHFEAAGHEIIFKADTASKQQGTDLIIQCGPTKLLIEVKGFPSKYYSAGNRRNEPKL